MDLKLTCFKPNQAYQACIKHEALKVDSNHTHLITLCEAAVRISF